MTDNKTKNSYTTTPVDFINHNTYPDFPTHTTHPELPYHITQPQDISYPTTPVDFLEEQQPGVVYIQPKLDLSLSDKQKSDCWDILMEIRKFGINQRQLLFLVDLLAMEVESNVTMKAIRAATEAGRGKPPGVETSGLILP